jgi:hypothetical protein
VEASFCASSAGKRLKARARMHLTHTSFILFVTSRHFIDHDTLDAHKNTKLHKKRVKLLSEPAYTIEEANAAGGCGSADFYAKKLEKIKPKFATHADKQHRKALGNPASQSLLSYE